jgi:hypothetical protein
MNSCERLKHHLLKHGFESVQRHELLKTHLDECEACRRLLHSWIRVPDLLEQLPEHEPDELLLLRTRNAVRNNNEIPAPAIRRVPRLATSLASAAVLLAAIGLSRQLFDSEFPPLTTPVFKEEYENVSGAGPESLALSAEQRDMPPGADPSDAYTDNRQTGDDAESIIGGHANSDLVIADRTEIAGTRNSLVVAQRPGEEEDLFDTRRLAETQGVPATTGTGAADIGLARGNEDKQKAARREMAGGAVKIAGAIQSKQALASPPASEFGAESGARPENRERQLLNKVDDDGWLRENTLQDGTEGEDKPFLEDSLPETREYESLDESFYRKDVAQNHRDGDREVAQSSLSADTKANKNRPLEQAPFEAELSEAVSDGFDFFGYYQSPEQMHFQPAEGYWANTHVPGDPAIRLLRTRLAAWDRSGSVQLAGLEQDVRPVSQPFDAPSDNALALSVMSDANAVEGATRMRLQVGIRGIEHRRGQRPAMNMGLVIDLPADANDDTRIAARALLDAVLASKQPGDRFSLVINGPGGLVVPPDDFRFGPLQLARQAIAADGQADPDTDQDLAQAISRAGEFVRQTDDPSLPLGSSSILLISANSLNNADQLRAQIHAQATHGITLSVVPLGNRPESSQVEQLVLAGLGSRRILDAPDQARQLIEAELHASSRAVARAARLSVRLAPGVRLIDVVGSERLDSERSQRVRDIESSMDSRLSANLGIEADRGEDEGGIQIVIPSIFSGDDVTVLLDVLVDRPGDIASVSLRYKDLVYLRNGKLSGQLSLPPGALERGPEEHAVIKNLLAHHFGAAASRAADALGRQQPAQAAAILAKMRDEITALRKRVPAFMHDPELQRDQQILDRYINVLGSPGAYQPELADSLRYAAWAKAHRPPAEWK